VPAILLRFYADEENFGNLAAQNLRTTRTNCVCRWDEAPHSTDAGNLVDLPYRIFQHVAIFSIR
jgi:hypothetical protein